MEKEVVEGNRPQDDVPVERIIHYIVKDYQRMFNQEQDYLKKISILKETNRNLRENMRKILRDLRARQVANIPDDKLRIMIQGLRKKADDYDALKEENAKLLAQIEEVRANHSDLLESVTSDLEEKLKEANRRIELLAKAVVEPSEADSIFLRQCRVHTIETDDEREWLEGATNQLEKAATKLMSVEERLAECDTILKTAENTQEVTRMLKVINRLSTKLEGTISHIECFFDKVGDIKIAKE